MYYLRDLTADDWEKFHEMDSAIFPDEPLSKNSFLSGLAGYKALTVIAIHKESKDFLGYYRIGVYGKEGHVYRIGVHPNFRRKKLGSVLLERSMTQLEKAGCTEYFLYVRADNEPAVKLYEKYGFEKEVDSHQFICPFKLLKGTPRGNCRHVEWGEVQLVCLRFELNPIRIQQYFGQEDQHVLIFEVNRQQMGFARLTPSFPGAFPFIVKDSEYALDFIGHLKEHITNPEFDYVRLTFDGQPRLVEKLTQEKLTLNYKLLKMTKEVTT